MEGDIRVLHVDDAPEFVELTRHYLEREDERITVTTATSAAAALDLLSGDIDCIVSDYEMPDTNGIELLEAVREEHPDLPFILFTGKGSEEVASDAISAGVTDYLRKRIGTEQYELLTARIDTAVGQYRAERELERQYERLDTVASNAPVVLFTLDPDGVFTVSKGRGLEQLGVESGEVVGQSVFDVYGGHEGILSDAQRALDGEQVTATREVDGLFFETTYQPVFEDRDGDLRAVIGVAVDVRDRIRREQQSRRYEAIVEAIDDAIYVVDEDDRIEYVNERYAEMKNADREELLGTPIREWADDEDARRVYELVDELQRGKRDVATIEYDFLTADGRHVPVESRITNLEYPDGGQGRVGVVRDVTERREREQKLERQNERLEEFVSVVSHDLRNPLNTLAASLDLVEADDEHLHRCRRLVDRMDRLIESLLALAREGDTASEPTRVNLREAATASWQVVESPDVELTVEPEADASVLVDEERFEQLLENLFHNAVEHGVDVGRVTVGTLPDGFYVADDGVGIPPEERTEMFETGYTTGEDENTGFGLSIVERIVEAHDWEVRATESADCGAQFEITGVEFDTDSE